MSWVDLLQSASFNGVPFYIDTTQKAFGRRLVVHEYPERDDPFMEDLGRLPRRFTVKAYVLGDLYMVQRLLLETALESSDAAGVLIHPTYGILSVWVGNVRSGESRADGGYATIEFECVVDGGAASPLSITDTVSALLGGLSSLTPFLEAAYVVGVGVGAIGAGVASVVGAQLTSANAAFAALPQATQAGIVPGFAAAVTSPAATAAAVNAAFSAAADNVIAAQAVTVSTPNPVNGVVGALVAPVDPTGGLLALASFGTTLTPLPVASLAALVNAQAAVVTLVQGAALSAALTCYAQFAWQSANQAAAALAAVLPLLDAQVAAAADAGNYDLFRAWRAISAATVKDFNNRAQSLPVLANYSVPSTLPALVISQMLYQTGTQADALVALNQAPHPLFMPSSGQWLEAA